MKNRSRVEIIESILEEASEAGGAHKTRLMYGAYLSYTQIEEYLEFMLAKGLLQFDEASRSYVVTQKGEEYRKKLDEMNELLLPA